MSVAKIPPWPGYNLVCTRRTATTSASASFGAELEAGDTVALADEEYRVRDVVYLDDENGRIKRQRPGETDRTMYCNHCGNRIEDGQVFVDRFEDPADKDAPLTIAWFCPTCAEPESEHEPWRETRRVGRRTHDHAVTGRPQRP
jgi:hypothetical protein